MPTVRYGAAPSLAKKREFANVPFNAHIPHYAGYCPQVRFRSGKSLTKLSHDVANELPFYTGPTSKMIYSPEIPPSFLPVNKSIFKDEVPGQKVPLQSGTNKYFNDMIPGFSGDLMRSPFHFGKRYRALTRDCIDEFINEYERREAKMADLQEHSTMFPSLRPILGDPRVRDHMNFWTDATPNRPILLEDKRGPREAAMPGYTGFIPRFYVTETGLGVRYQAGTENSMNVFRDEVEGHQKKLRTPYTLTKGPGDGFTYRKGPAAPLSVKAPKMEVPEMRIYRKEGMIPGYEGTVPGYFKSDGYNYGDGTRKMKCCNHDKPSYGAFLASQS